ncbi:MAG: ASKHA domain-containing protein, partial [Candidatus Hodarchaeota archaeon]
AEKLRLKISKNGNVYTAPIIAGFVGADTIGVILSSQIYNEKLLTLAIDIGTNGEIIVGNRNNLMVGSCAAGSALEGAHIDNGMRAAAGAIDSIKIDPTNFDVSYTTIKNKKPIGICGSGLVDGIAEMLKSKIITRSGNFNRELIDHERFIKNEKNIKFIITNKEETSIGTEISISQSDVRQIQMAKAAFYSGMRIILNHLSKDLKIKQIFLAGAFGNYINPYNAKFIGMIPDIPDNKIFQIGNAAGTGAQYLLLNKDLRANAQNLLHKIDYIEIAVEKNFQKEYAEAMYFPHLNLDFFPSLKEYIDIPKR